MIETGHIYYHPHLDHHVQVTEQQGNWVEFIEQGADSLRWLEQSVFNQAYQYYNQGDPINHDLKALRAQASQKGLLVPREFS
jgi:hypothetical protein